MRHLKPLMLGIGAALLLGATGCANMHRDSDRTAGRVVDDNRITRNVEDNLSKEPVYKFSDVDVKTFNGVVQLSGFVNTDEQKRRAAEIAQKVDGVQQVVNSIALKANQLTPTGRSTTGLPPVTDQSTNTGTNNAPVTNK